MKFDEIYALVGHVPFISKDHGKYLYDMIIEQQLTSFWNWGSHMGRRHVTWPPPCKSSGAAPSQRST